MGVEILGPLQVDHGEVQLGARDRMVLSALVMRPGQVLSPEQLADAVWGEQPPATWAKGLQGCVSRLRKHLGSDAVRTTPRGYQLVLPADAVDAWQFERYVARAQELLTLKEPERAHFTVTQALELWRGAPLTELGDWAPGVQEATRLAELRLGAEELQLDAALASGHHREVLARAQDMVEAAPFRERRWTLLALAQYRSGQQAEALRTLRRLRRLLAEELGLDPTPDAMALEQAILRQESSLSVNAALPVEASRSPYLGLRPYDESDAESFFGRDDEVSRCLDRVTSRGVLAVVGPSGSGKSTLVRAGVAAALRRDGRTVAVLVPGRHPTETLAEPLSQPRRPVLVVDQAEEAFSLCHDAAERTRFLDALCDYAQQTPVVMSMRADRMGDVATHLGFTRLVERGMFLLGAMSSENLRLAIEGPARQAGLVIEPGLVDLVVREVEGEPGALPLLSHTLRETWLRREGRTLTVTGYQASGGVRGAVSQSAEQLYAGVPEHERNRLKELMLRLVAPGTQGEPVRARMPRRLVVADAVQERLVDQLVSARLVTSDEGVVEIAHESLARAWPRLRGWLDDDVEGRRILHHLVATADAWDTLGRPDSELYRGVRLTAALAWREANRPELTPVEQHFLHAGQEAAEAEERSAAERARHQAGMIRRLRITLAGAAVLLVLALVAGLLALRQAGAADQAAQQANRAALAESARRVGAKALVTEGATEALLLAAAGVRLDDSPDTRSSLLGVLFKHPELVRSMPMEGTREVMRVAVHPEETTVVTYDDRHRLRLYDLTSGEVVAEYQAGRPRQEWVWQGAVAFDRDGRTIAATTAVASRSPVVLLDAATLRPLRQQPEGLPRRPWQAYDLAFDRDGSHLAVLARRTTAAGNHVAEQPPVATVWRLSAPGRPEIVPVAHSTTAVDLDLDGRTLFTNDPATRVDLDTGRTTHFALGGFAAFGAVELSPDGRLLALAGGYGGDTLRLVDAETGEVHRRLDIPEATQVWEPRFTPDGGSLVTVTWNERRNRPHRPPSRTTRLWDLTTGEPRMEFEQDAGQDGAFALSLDGRTLFSASPAERALRLWDLTGRGHLLEQVHEGRGVVPAGFADVAPGGRFATYAGPFEDRRGSSERRWFLDLEHGTLVGPLDAAGFNMGGGSWAPDGRSYATAVGGVIRIYDPATGEVLLRNKPSGDEVVMVDHSADGPQLVIAEANGDVTLLNEETLAPVGKQVRAERGAGTVALGPDGRNAVVLDGLREPLDQTLWAELPSSWSLVDLEAGTVRREGVIGFPALWVEMSPDGRYAAISGRNGELLVVDLTTGRPVRPFVRAHQSGVYIFKFSPDGRRILTSGTDGAVVLWSTDRGEPLATVRAPGRPFVSAAFVDDNTVMISDWAGAAAWTWDTRLEPALQLACRAAGRDLTRQEWQDNFGDRPYQETCPQG